MARVPEGRAAGFAVAAGELLPVEPNGAAVAAELAKQRLAGSGPNPADNFLRGDALAATVGRQQPLGAAGRLSVPPTAAAGAPADTLRVDLVSRLCLASQVHERQVTLHAVAAAGAGSGGGARGGEGAATGSAEGANEDGGDEGANEGDDDGALLRAASTTTAAVGHADLQLGPGRTTSALSLVRAHCKSTSAAAAALASATASANASATASAPAAAGETVESAASSEPVGYPVFRGVHFCGGLSCDFELTLSEIPPAESAAAADDDAESPAGTAAAWDAERPHAARRAFGVLAAARRVASAANAACAAHEAAALERTRPGNAQAADAASVQLQALAVVGDGFGLKAFANDAEARALGGGAQTAAAAAIVLAEGSA